MPRGIRLQETSPTLFLTIVAIGARFWRVKDTNNKTTHPSPIGPVALHPHYFDIIKLLDSSISRLLLCPSAADASLSTIQSLLLNLQWLPYERCSEPLSQETKHVSVQTRYNEMSSWAVFGLALRYAEFCGLEQKVLGAFQDDTCAAASTQQDLESIRVWLNMVTYDCNLTLTSGLPTLLDPRPMKTRAYRFCSHFAAQEPGDVRYASTVELAYIIKNVRHQKDKITERYQVLAVIADANGEFEKWQRYLSIVFVI